jgi:murein DD-endopeptidase MepM/ murein hydrolase activator NlpD
MLKRIFIILFLATLIPYIIFKSCKNQTGDEIIPVVEAVSFTEESEIQTDPFGITEGFYEISERRIRNGESLSHLLSPFGVSGAEINSLVQASNGVFNVRRIVSGRPVHFYNNPDTGQLDYMVYQQNNREFVVFTLGDEPAVYLGEREQTTELRMIEGEISNSLYVAILEAGGNPALVSGLSNVFAWQVDFYRIFPGDSFAVLYEERYIDGQSAGVGRIHAARLEHRGKVYDAIYFNQDGKPDYFDIEGNSLRKAFLRAPLEYSRISSRFTNRRFHPVLRRNMPHHGTDYAAPTGTPIRAVGDGEIIHAGYDRNNGNYIRIRHNSVYETGYLHMSRLANGMRRGTRVTQGQIIGYVGATGLATGPHLCFRFWQNGQPVDPYRVDMPASNPIAAKYRSEFEVQKNELLALLFPDNPEIVAKQETHYAGMNPNWSPTKPLILLY